MEKQFAIGIDMGGTNTVSAVVDRRGNIVCRDVIPTRVEGEKIEGYISRLRDSVNTLIQGLKTDSRLEELKREIKGIGIGAPCANAATGCIEAATDLPWPSPIPLKELLERALHLPVAISNDANAAAAGEYAYGAAKGINNFMMITLGTGVGSGIVCDGQLLSGARGFAGELGHCRASVPRDRMCGCGRKGCLQTYCSASGILTTARQLLSSDSSSSLNSVDPETLTPAIISQHAAQGDNLAKKIFEITGTVLGEACAEFAAFSDPEAIILFGGISKAGDLIINPMKKALNANTLHLYRNRINIFQSSLPEADAALLGASALAW